MADCEWNPERHCPAVEGDKPHGSAKWSVGSRGEWHLCDDCAALPPFRKYRTRVALAQYPNSPEAPR